MTQPTFNREELIRLGQLVLELFTDWHLSSKDQIRLLGIAKDVRPHPIRQLHAGMPLPEDAAILERVKLLINIDSALRTTFPHNNAMGSYWIAKPNKSFGQSTPLSIMLSDLDGLRRVRDHLDCTQTWY